MIETIKEAIYYGVLYVGFLLILCVTVRALTDCVLRAYEESLRRRKRNGKDSY